ncbi:type II toxin-antitoxin system RelE family toxin [Methylophilus luteus]|uniref:Type II toxin-antitoxin system RelE/ParE family toxin n=1 Tax=Methylophilus luteus TaxID=640108 RepID=A0ABW3F9D3_9PROT
MSYSVSIKESAFKALARIDKPHRQRLIEAIEKLKISPTAGSVLKGEFSGLRRIRVGDYRIVYEVQDAQLVILVIRIAHRREVYK